MAEVQTSARLETQASHQQAGEGQDGFWSPRLDSYDLAWWLAKSGGTSGANLPPPVEFAAPIKLRHASLRLGVRGSMPAASVVY